MKVGDFHVLDPRLYQVADEIEAARKAAATPTLSTAEAEAAGGAKEYAVLEGPPLNANASTAAQQPTQLPPSAPSATASIRELVAAQNDALRVVEKHLATFIGPVAKIHVKKAASQARNTEELYSLLSENLEREADRKLFLAKGVEASRNQVQSRSFAEPAAASTASRPKTPAARTDLTREAIDRAAAMLARYVGPISSVLAKRAAQRANNLGALYQLLAEHVETKADRARFLREAGLPDRE